LTNDEPGPTRALQRELEAVEQALRESEERFASAFEHAAIGMALVGPDGRWLKVNRAVSDMLGYTPDELLARTFQDLTFPEDLEVDLGYVHEMLDGLRQTYQMEKRYLHKSGRIVWALLSVSIVRDGHAEAPYFISQIQDITPRKRAQEELQRAASMLEQVVNATPDMIFVKDRELRTILCNQSFARARGKQPADLIGRTDVDNGWEPSLVFGDPESGTRGFVHDDREVLAGHVVRNPHDLGNVNGEVRIFDTHKLPLRDAAGEVVAVLGVSRDITDLKRAEERRLSLERQVQYAQKLESLGLMAGGVAHDFNNLLTSILGYADLAWLACAPDSEARELLDEVLRGVRQAAELTQQMLAYAGKGTIEPSPVVLSHVVDEMRPLIEISVSKRCRVAYANPISLPPIRADKASMRQIVMNLAINAAEAIGDRRGTILIDTGTRRCDKAYLQEAWIDDRLPEGAYVFLRVADDGCGMSAETRARIFDPFFTTKFTGRGLGLATVLGIVRAHRGCIKVDSEPGRGTTFTVLFPVNERDVSPPPVA